MASRPGHAATRIQSSWGNYGHLNYVELFEAYGSLVTEQASPSIVEVGDFAKLPARELLIIDAVVAAP